MKRTLFALTSLAAAAVAVALADKLDTLVGFFAIGEKPTGSGDPYALRRAALGVIRIMTESLTFLKLEDIVALAIPEATATPTGRGRGKQ